MYKYAFLDFGRWVDVLCNGAKKERGSVRREYSDREENRYTKKGK
jgi:hypothetical protein